MGRRSEHSKQQLQDMALAVARGIIADEGLAGLSARKIASGIGYTVGTLYLVFDNLDDLIIQVNARTLDDMHDFMLVKLKRCRRDDQCIYALGKGYIQFATEHHHLWSAIFEHQLPDGRQLPDWFVDKVVENFALVEQALIPYTGSEAKKKMQVLSMALWGGVHGVCVLGFSGKINIAGSNSVQLLAETLIRNFLAGLRK